MRFLADRCAGHRLAEWLRHQGHDVLESSALGADPGDEALLRMAHEQQRILVTIDTDFGALAFRDKQPHAGMVRLPDVPAAHRIQLMQQLLEHHEKDLHAAAVVTIRGGRIRITTT
jgi:predicted nuclease of predicted toxin-antitoxin system